MSQVASTSAGSQEETLQLVNAAVQQPKTQRFQLANQAFDVRMVGTLEDPGLLLLTSGGFWESNRSRTT
jgi:hypothetical protein